MKKIATLLALVALCLGGCAQMTALEQNLASPTTTQAAQNVAVFIQAVECFVSVVAGATNTGLVIANAKGQTASLIIYTISAGLCQNKFGGTPNALVSVPASAVVMK